MNRSDKSRDAYMLKGIYSKEGYDWWTHTFTAINRDTNKEQKFFIHYYVVNPGLGKKDEEVAANFIDEKNRPSLVMIEAGTWGKEKIVLRRFLNVDKLKADDNVLDLYIEDCTLSEKSMSGSIYVDEEKLSEYAAFNQYSDMGSISWKLTIDKLIPFNIGHSASAIGRKINLVDMYWHAEGMKTKYSGEINLNGTIYDVIADKSYGYADKKWGKNYTNPCMWLNCSNIVSKITGEQLDETVFNIGGGRLKSVGMTIIKRPFVGLYYEGTNYEYNFTKIGKVKIRHEIVDSNDQLLWKIKAINRESLFEVKVKCNKSEMTLTNFISPDGNQKYSSIYAGGTGYGEARLFHIGKKKKKQIIDHFILKNVNCEYGMIEEGKWLNWDIKQEEGNNIEKEENK